MNFIEINGEKILAITLFGRNRSDKVTEYHQKVMVEHFLLNINYIECPFPMVSHGQMMNLIIKDTIDTIKPDYYWFLDNDCIILKKEAIDIFYNLVSNKIGIAGHVQQSNHKKNKITNSLIHPYCSQAFLWFSSELFNKLNRPCMDHWSEDSDEFGGDTAERLTFAVEENGGIISMIWPSEVYLKNSNINHLMFGMGNIFGNNLIFHAMQQNNPESERLFIQKAKDVLDGKFS